MTEPDIEQLIENDRENLIQVLGPDGPQKVRDDTRKFYPRYVRAGERILKNYVQYLRRY